MSGAQLLDAQLVRHWAQAGLAALREHRQELNALNVFPVPDGDTGTNLTLTFQAAAEAEAARQGDDADAADALAAMARGALLGARGNSGIILAQVLQAFAVVAATEERLTLRRLISAGASAARSAVSDPVEGTALTVLDAAAAAAAREPEEAAAAAREALALTPTMLPDLARAGVVDAGGRGVVLLMDALRAVWRGEELNSPPVGLVPDEPPANACAADAEFELMFMLERTVSEMERTTLNSHGVSVAVTSNGVQSQVHIHTDSPSEVLAHFADADSIRIEPLRPRSGARLIVQASGVGNIQQLASLGALVVIGEPGHRASVRDFVTAGERVASDSLLILPSDDDSLKVVEYAATELRSSGKQVEIVATRTLQESLAAAAIFVASAELQQAAADLRAAAHHISSINIAIAERSAETDIGRVEAGQLIAFTTDGAVGVSYDIVDVVCDVLRHRSAELITLIGGAQLDADDLADVEAAVAQLIPEAEVVAHSGGQRGTLLLVGIE